MRVLGTGTRSAPRTPPPSGPADAGQPVTRGTARERARTLARSCTRAPGRTSEQRDRDGRDRERRRHASAPRAWPSGANVRPEHARRRRGVSSRSSTSQTSPGCERPDALGRPRHEQIAPARGSSPGSRRRRASARRRSSATSSRPDGPRRSRGRGPQRRRVELRHDPRADRAEGVETLGAGPLAVLLLEVARGDVVRRTVKPKTAPRRRPRRTSLARLPITTPSSASCSTRRSRGGSTTVPPGARRLDGGLKKRSGSAGTSLPSSFACAA